MKFYIPSIVLIIAFFSACGLGTAPTTVNKEETIALSPTTETNRQAVVAAYQTEFANPLNFVWNGSNTNCNPGTLSPSIQEKVKRRINYYRKMVGLADISIDETASNRAQKAALMMSANQNLSHFPSTSWKCYTSEGAYSAAHANLCFGCVVETAIDIYMQDPGQNNTSVGHRRWVLFSTINSFGHGSTDLGSALDWDTPQSSYFSKIKAVAYPPAGMIPSKLVEGTEPFRWSLGVPYTENDLPDFSKSTVEMTDSQGKTIASPIIYRGEAYGDYSLVWQTPLAATNISSDVTYHITVANVILGNEKRTYKYDVTIVKI